MTGEQIIIFLGYAWGVVVLVVMAAMLGALAGVFLFDLLLASAKALVERWKLKTYQIGWGATHDGDFGFVNYDGYDWVKARSERAARKSYARRHPGRGVKSCWRTGV